MVTRRWWRRVVTATTLALALLLALAGSARADGVWAWAWGYNVFGQVGDGTTTQRTIPVVSLLGRTALIGAGWEHSLALKGDGTVWASGWNNSGQLGDGTETQRTTPVAASGLSGVAAVAGGEYHSLALRGDGTVRAWGTNVFGELGDGTTTGRPTPVAVSGLTGVVAVAAGGNHNLALKGDGTVSAWGWNSNGQVGDGTTTNRLTAVTVSGLTGVAAVAGGYNHSLALMRDGTVRTWGYNEYGQLGDNTTTNRLTPVTVSGLTDVIAVTGGYFHSLALKRDGTVRAWGSNSFGKLGDGTQNDRRTPVQVSGLSGVVAIGGGDDHSLALKADGTVWAWGRNFAGQLGDGTTTTRLTPVQVSGLTGVVAITAGGNFSRALKGDGTVWSWGHNNRGQLGDGTTTNRLTPVAISALGALAPGLVISAGGYHSLALKGDGTVWAWGSNGSGRLGDGTTTTRLTPVAVSGLSGAVAIAAGWEHSLALKGDGTVWAWGYNGNGQLGDGTTTERHTRAAVGGLTGVVAIAAGRAHSLALMSDGTVRAWGANDNGQVGDGTTTMRLTPTVVGGLTGVVAVAAGSNHSLVLRVNGAVRAWGANGDGQVGDGTTTQRTTPVTVSGLSGVAAVETGNRHSLALMGDGTVRTWGWNNSGQLGDGTTMAHSAPVVVAGLSDVVAVAGGGFHSLAVKGDGTVRTWGSNGNGQLGDGTTAQRTTPVAVGGLRGAVTLTGGDFHSLAVTLLRHRVGLRLATSVSPAKLGQPVTLSATVMGGPLGARLPTGTVTFRNGGAVLGAAPLAGRTATLTTSNLPVGTHSITAEYGGDARYAGASAPALSQQVVAADTTTSLTITPNPAAAGLPITLAAQVSVNPPGSAAFDPVCDPVCDQVTFLWFSSGVWQTLGTMPLDAAGHASLTNAGFGIGTHNVKARFEGRAGSLNPSESPVGVLQVVTSVPTAQAGGPYTVAEGGQVSLTGAGSVTGDPTGDLLSYTWYRDSEFGLILGTGKVVPYSAAGLNGPDTRFAVLKACLPATATCGTSTATIAITNAAPTATLVAPTAVNRGSPLGLTLANPADPGGAADLAALEYAFDCGAGGGYGAWSPRASISCPVAGDAPPGPRSVHGRLRNTGTAEVSEYATSVLVRDWRTLLREDAEAPLASDRWFNVADPAGASPWQRQPNCFQAGTALAPKAAAAGCEANYGRGYTAHLQTDDSYDLRGALDARLSFRVLWDLNDGDRLTVYASTDGATWYSGWAPIGRTSWTSLPIEGGWTPVELDLAAWPGLGDLRGQARVWFEIRFVSADDGSQGLGPFLDDLELSARYPGGGGPEPPLPTAWYFAEGWTGPGFDEYLTIQNPNAGAAEVTITYYLTGAAPVTRQLTVAGSSRATVSVHEPASGTNPGGLGRDRAVSAKVESVNGVGVVVERPMYFRYGPAGLTGGHNVMGVTAPRTRWLFAEGYTGTGFDEYLTILNPGGAGTATLTYYLEGGAAETRAVPLPANSRVTVVVHDPPSAGNPGGLGRGKAHGTQVETDVPTVVERPIYFAYGGSIPGTTGGHNVMGAAEARTRWYFPDGGTVDGYDQYLTLMNRFGIDAQVRLTYYVVGEATPRTKDVTVPANSRRTVVVHDAGDPTGGGLGRGLRHGTQVEVLNGVAIVAERPTYFRYNGSINGGHNVMGAAQSGPTWLFAEGWTGANFYEELVLLNPNATAASVTITYQRSGGKGTVNKQVVVAAYSRYRVEVNGLAEGVGSNEAVSAKVETAHPGGIVAERPMYFIYGNGLDGGHTVMGFAP